MTDQKILFNFIIDKLPVICSLQLAFCLLLGQQPLRAQTPDASQSQSPIRRSPRSPVPPLQPPSPAPLPPPEELLQETPTPGTEEIFPDVPGSVVVEEFRFEGNTAFSDKKLAEITAPFTGRPISFSELLGARTAISELYVSEGYITSGALIPPQSFDSGIVTIQIIEGTLEGLEVTGEGKLKSGYVRDRIRLATKQPVNQDRLLRALQLLQLDPLIERVSAELSAGSAPGQSFLKITYRSADSFYTNFFTNNSRVPSVGTWRRGVRVGDRNFLGFGDSFSVAYTNTEGSNEFETTYTIPVNARNGTVALRFDISGSDIIESPFDELDIESGSRTYEIIYRQPIAQKPTEEFVLGFMAARRESDNFVLGEGFPLSAGANDEGQTRLSVLRTFQEYTSRGPRYVFAARSLFSVGLDIFDTTINDEEPDGEFFSWRFQTQYVRELTENAIFLARGDLQLTPGALVSLEQIGIGGFDSVRGYRQDSLLTDNGAFATAELRYAIFRTGDREGVLQVVPFVDVGTGWNTKEANPDTSTLVSVGVGLRWEYSDRINARIEWGIPLVEVESRGDSLQEDGIYFSVEFTPF
ncbi:MAG: ShlB/FhaC/HecB family hemolysin secretion/activation protein [Cyanobacteriota bacterium]|nr:ShlB/FhaC/HecB family hemolysin secretion/activation protein [Cyanobacteriota bacterium]